ncbi:MAG: DUF6020 family protein [Candidatus Saccharimonas sp.]
MSGWLVLVYVFGFMVIWGLILLSFSAVKQWTLRVSYTARVPFLRNLSDKKLWLLISLAMFLCYLPVIILCISVLTPDSWSSVRQVIGDVPLSNAHPIIFTGFVSIFIHIGLFFGSITLGTLLFSLVQSALLAMIFSVVIVWMRREGIGRNAAIATFIFYAILPVNAFAGIVMWKDILFSGFGLLLLILLRQLYIQKGAFFTKKNVACFVVFAFLFCTWRNNGLYAYLAFLVLAMAIDRRTLFHKKYLALLLSPIVMFVGYSVVVSLVATPASSTVMMTVPLQQIARTVKYHGSSLSEEDRASINEILAYDKLGTVYNPNLSDPVLYTFKQETYKSNEGKYIKLWLKLFLEHKKTYIAATLYNTYGYFYPQFVSTSPTDTVMDNASHLNALKDYTDEPYNHGSKLAVVRYQELLTSSLPFLRSIGFYTLVMIFGVYVAIIKKRRELIWVFVILSCLLVTTLLGPVNGEFRYLYLFVVATPFIVGSAYSSFNLGKSRKKHV